MLSSHHSEVKWFSFLILLFILILELPSPTTSGKCEERCDLDRLPGSTKAYTLNCDHVYENPDDIRNCQNDCAHCSSAICNSTNPSIFHCPRFERDPERCKQRCDTNRPSWSPHNYNLYCTNEYGKPHEIEFCQSFCKDCPREICVISTPDIYKCSSKNGHNAPISGYCSDLCNENRPKQTTGAYTMSCLKAYGTSIGKLQFCRDTCSNAYCPRDVCSPYDPDIYHCPILPLTGHCKDRCDNHREPGTTEAFTVNCQTAYDTPDEVEYCSDDCYSCPLAVCDPNRDKTVFRCPEIPHPLPPPPPPTYWGSCEKRCNDNRPIGLYGKSNDPYTLKCDKAYNFVEDSVARCRRDCRSCPSEVCQKNDPNTYHCRAFKSRKRCDNICAANRKMGSKDAFYFNCSNEYSLDLEIQYCQSQCFNCESYNCNSKISNDSYYCNAVYEPSISQPEPYPSKNPLNRGLPTWQLAVWVIVGFLILVPCVGTCIYCCCLRQKRRVNTGQYSGPAAGGYPFPGQQQQPYPMNFNYTASQQSASSLSIASSASTSKSAMFGH